MLPVIEGDHLVCPYCKTKQIVYIVNDKAELRRIVRDVKEFFQVRPHANYHIAEFCKGCATVWLGERVNPRTNEGKPFAWDTYTPFPTN